MTEAFKNIIKNYPYPLFYNSEGSTIAYKLCIRHLSAASFAGLALEASGYVYPKDTLHIVDLENETIELFTDEIKLIKMKNLT
jgi:hypothetical protein